MGYTTRFSGTFKLSRQFTLDEFQEVKGLYDSEPEGSPGAYCQWVPTRDGKGLEWDGAEKFYNYVEWLRYIVDKKLKPWGIECTGQVKWQGEEMGDVGVLSVVDGRVVAQKLVAPGVKAECPACGHHFQVRS